MNFSIDKPLMDVKELKNATIYFFLVTFQPFFCYLCHQNEEIMTIINFSEQNSIVNQLPGDLCFGEKR